MIRGRRELPRGAASKLVLFLRFPEDALGAALRLARPRPPRRLSSSLRVAPWLSDFVPAVHLSVALFLFSPCKFFFIVLFFLFALGRPRPLFHVFLF